MPPKKNTKAKKADSDDEPPKTRTTRSKIQDKVESKAAAVSKKAEPKAKSRGKKKASPSPSPSPPPKKTAPRKGKSKDSQDDGKRKSSRAAAAKKKTPTPSPSPSPQKKVKGEDEGKNVKTMKFTGTAPVDEYVMNKDNYKVYEENGVIYDCMMNQTNIQGGNNNNKFYVVQVLETLSSPHQYYAFNRWGRVGVEGQHAMKPFGANKDGAIRDFNHKKNDKSVKGDYRVLERDYNFGADPETLKKKEDEAYSKSKLHPKVKDLIRMIFDMKMINRAMKEIGYDADKMPLGKLAASTIKKGFDVLKQLSEELKKAKSERHKLEELTSEFYSQIPHNFGMQRAPLIDSDKKVKEKLEMLESIQHIQVATKILEDQKDDDGNMLDSNYEKLKTSVKYLEESDEKTKLIREYIKNTHAPTHSNYTLEVFDVYELQKDLDDERFKKDIGNRMLLWHGSRITNFVGILSQGLRIAPPEAPVTGYMFGKGVYFADMVSKSANYCGTSRDNPIGCILLADVALGNTNEKFYADYNASNLPPGKSSTYAKGKTAPPASSYIEMPGMKGVTVPIGKYADTAIKNTSLLYNEYIVYDVAQIRLKYLIKMKWNYK